MIFTVEFGKSPSKGFGYALNIAKKAPTFQITGTPSLERYSATYDQLPDFIELAQQVRGWKSTRLMINNNLLSVPEYIYLCQVQSCYDKKQEFINQHYYCLIGQDGSKSLFPCRFIRFYRYELSNGKFGRICQDIVILNKDHLRFALEQQIRKTMCYCCPDMNMERLLNSVDSFPDELPFEKSMSWPKGIVVSIKESSDSQKDKDAKNLENLLKDIEGLE